MRQNYKLLNLAARLYRRGNRALENVSALCENYLNPRETGNLVVLDDIFPHRLSSFRIAEYNAYLDHFSNAAVYSTASAFSILHEKRDFRDVRNEYEKHYPQFKNRVFKFNENRRLRPQLVYTMFLANTFRFLSVIEKWQAPFVFTLYPGGGFLLDQERSDEQLRTICSSPNLKKVIVTQKISYEYLIDKEFLDPAQVELIYGGVFPSHRIAGELVQKTRYQNERSAFNICFVAHKYMSRGLDKGYDVFIEVAKLLSRTHEDVRFHVVGPFDASDIEIDDIQNKMTFHGVQQADFFSNFYRDMDIILSPNAPFVSNPGAFDGFPTGCCMEAGLCGVAVFCTDVLNQNMTFKDGEEIVIVSRNATEVCQKISGYYGNLTRLQELSQRGQQAFSRVFDLEAQMAPRLRILSEFMSDGLTDIAQRSLLQSQNQDKVA